MGGLSKICKAFGGLKVVDKKGNEANWEYDYKKDKPIMKNKRQFKSSKLSEKLKKKESLIMRNNVKILVIFISASLFMQSCHYDNRDGVVVVGVSNSIYKDYCTYETKSLVGENDFNFLKDSCGKFKVGDTLVMNIK